MIRFISPLMLLGWVLSLSLLPPMPAEAATSTYINLKEGIRFDHEASWSLTETESSDGLRLHMLDPLAAGAPIGRGAFTAGATIQVNVLYKPIPTGVDQELLSGAATSGNLETHGSVVIAGHSGSYVETSSDADGGIRTRTVAFSAGSRVVQLVLAVVGTSTLSVDAVARYSADFDLILESLQIVNPPASGVSSLSDEFLILPAAKPLIVQQGWYYHPDVGGGLHQAIDFVDTAINNPATAFTVTASASGTATYIVGDGWNGGLGLYVQKAKNRQEAPPAGGASCRFFAYG